MGSTEPRHHRFTSEQVLRMVELGILDEGPGVELVEGELLDTSPQGPAHRALTIRIHQLLETAFGTGFHVQDHSPIAIGHDSLPEPDVAVIRGPLDFTRLPTSADTALVVEISVTSQRTDRRKARVYGVGGVPEYWNLDLARRTLEIHRDPRPELGGYATASVLGEEDTVTVEGTVLAVSALLPPR